MSEENRSFYIALRVKDIPTPPLRQTGLLGRMRRGGLGGQEHGENLVQGPRLLH